MPETLSERTFDKLAGRYDLLVDWPRRLAREGPFFRWLFDTYDVRSVVDPACGTGHHAALFHTWGLKVEGSDISSAMIEICREKHGTPEGLRWVQRTFFQRPSAGAFDAAICIGNSLALADDMASAASAVETMVDAVRPGGVGVIQLLNPQALDLSKLSWQKVRRVEFEGRDTLLIKTLHGAGDRIAATVLQVNLGEDPVDWHSHSATMLNLGRERLEGMLSQAGGTITHLYGSYARDDFDAVSSPDLIVVWTRSRLRGDARACAQT